MSYRFIRLFERLILSIEYSCLTIQIRMIFISKSRTSRVRVRSQGLFTCVNRPKSPNVLDFRRHVFVEVRNEVVSDSAKSLYSFNPTVPICHVILFPTFILRARLRARLINQRLLQPSEQLYTVKSNVAL